MVTEADQAWGAGRAGAHAEQQVVTARLKLRRPEDLELEVVALRDARRFLRERVRRQLVGRGVLPLSRAVGRLAVLLRRDDLGLAPDAETGEDQLVDLAALGRWPGLAGAPLEGAHDGALDDSFERVHAERLDPHDGEPLVAPGARGADELVVGRAKALPVQVVERAEPVQDHATRGHLALRRDGQDLVDASAELGVGHHLPQDAAHGAVEVLGPGAQRLPGRDRDRERVDVQLGGGRRDQGYLHGRLRVNRCPRPGARLRAREHGPRGGGALSCAPPPRCA